MFSKKENHKKLEEQQNQELQKFIIPCSPSQYKRVQQLLEK